MSTLNVTTLKHESAGVDNLVLDSSGNTIMPYGSSLSFNSPTNQYISADANNLYLGTGNLYRIKVDTAGRVTMPYQPSFRAYLSAEWSTVSATINSGWTTQYDRGNNFNQGTFTAPVAGSYWFSIMWDSLSAQGAIELRVNGQPYARWEPTGRTDDSWESHYYSTPVYLQASDFVTLYLSTGGGSNPIHMGSGHWGHFGGYLIG